jgi:hypothetical protein
MTQDTSSTANTSENHNALVIPMSDGYTVSCSCGWSGGHYGTPGPAEQVAKRHEADPSGEPESSHP